LGHAKPPSLILLELLVSHTLSPLTNAEVRLCLVYSFHGFLLCFFLRGFGETTRVCVRHLIAFAWYNISDGIRLLKCPVLCADLSLDQWGY
jgi:hypothetical protein